MKIFNYEIRRVLPEDQEIKHDILDKVEQNAKAGLVHARLELRHHSFLLDEAPKRNRTEAEIKGYKDAIERDEKTIDNFKNQLRAIEYERTN
jgi:hypothetical protein